MGFNDVFYNRKAKASSAQLPGPSLVYSVETFKDAGKVLLWNPNTGIPDGDFNGIPSLFYLQADLSIIWSVLDGIIQNVNEDLDQFFRITYKGL